MKLLPSSSQVEIEPVHDLGVSGKGGNTRIRWISSDRLISIVGMGPFLFPFGHVLFLSPSVESLVPS